MAKMVVLSAGLKTHKNRLRPGLHPDSTGLAYTAPPDLLVGGQGG